MMFLSFNHEIRFHTVPSLRFLLLLSEFLVRKEQRTVMNSGTYFSPSLAWICFFSRMMGI